MCKKINNLPIGLMPLPHLETQLKTVQYLDQLSQKTETLKQVQTKKMESLKALKASILDRAFRGGVVMIEEVVTLPLNPIQLLDCRSVVHKIYSQIDIASNPLCY